MQRKSSAISTLSCKSHQSRTFLTKHPTNDYPDAAENLLNILERLNTFPTEASELNEWWVPELGVKPPPTKSKSSKLSQETEGNESDDDEAPEDEDDWRKFFDEPESSSIKPGSNNIRGRLHKMTVHQSLHSLASHRAVFSRAWLTLLPRLSEIGKKDAEKSKALSMKALNVMHRSVLPHLTRPVMIMDWIGSCVDYGWYI
jgi:U3 small nucleolar RNA-associated protein 19